MHYHENTYNALLVPTYFNTYAKIDKWTLIIQTSKIK